MYKHLTIVVLTALFFKVQALLILIQTLTLTTMGLSI